MLIEHRGQTPSVHDSAYVAPTAVLCGDVVLGPGSRVLHGAVLTAEDGQVRVGRDVVIMENAVVKGRAEHPAVIGDFVLVGPHAHVNGADVRAGAFIATGAALFPGSVIGSGAEVRVNGVVQVNTTVEAGSVVPIGWVAVGTPATVRPPDQHRDIWAIQRELDFPGTVYGVPRGTSMRVIMEGQSAFYGAHADDVVVGSEGDETSATDESAVEDRPAVVAGTEPELTWRVDRADEPELHGGTAPADHDGGTPQDAYGDTLDQQVSPQGAEDFAPVDHGADEVEAVEARALEDQAGDDRTVDDRTVEDRAVEDEAVDDVRPALADEAFVPEHDPAH